jgi:hypothetical protein
MQRGIGATYGGSQADKKRLIEGNGAKIFLRGD